MTFDSLQVLYLVSAIAIGWVAVFLCWGLYELAKLLHKANQVVEETEHKIQRIEHAVMSLKDRLESSVNYLGILAEGGKAVLGMIQSHFQNAGNDSEDDEEAVPSKKKKKSKLFEDVGME